MQYVVQVPLDATGEHELRSQVETLFSGDVNPTLWYAAPDPLNLVEAPENEPPVVAGLTVAPDPVARATPITLTAQGGSDPDGEVVRVAFYRGNELLGIDENGGDGWSLTVGTAGWALGQHTLSARAQDNRGAWSEAATATATLVNAAPVVGDLIAVPDPLTRGDELTVTATGVSDPDGRVVLVDFLRWHPLSGWEWIAMMVPGDPGDMGDGVWSATAVDTAGWQPGDHTIRVDAWDNDGAWVTRETTFTIENVAPVVAGLTVAPDAVPRGTPISLTAEGVSDPDGEVVRVNFYRDTNGNGVWDSGDARLGTVEANGPWVLAGIDTADWVLGDHTLFARAQDNDGAWSKPVRATGNVTNTAPLVAAVTAAPDSVIQGDPILLTAEGVTDPDGHVVRVAFYRGSELLGIDENGGDGWSLTVGTAGWAPGEQTLSARAQDDDGAWSAPASTTVLVKPKPPTYDLVGRVPIMGYWFMSAGNRDGGFTTERSVYWSPGVQWVDVLVGDFNGNGFDDIAGRNEATGDWYVAVNNGRGRLENQYWGRWSPNVQWLDVQVGDFTGDGRDDIVGRVDANGDWWVAKSSDTGFVNERWGRWSPNVEWVDVQVGDFHGDGRDDLVGRVARSGDWWVAQSAGSRFVNARWGRWSPKVEWGDVMIGDFTGDGRDDLVGRVAHSGDWWVAQSAGSRFVNARWGRWSPNVQWLDVQVGDFHGDSRDDIVGRVARSGDWWIARSTGIGFTNAHQGRWESQHVTWDPVLVGNFLPAAAALHAEAAPASNSQLPVSITQADLAPIVEEAVLRLSPDLAKLAFQVQLVDLPGLMLGRTVGNTIQIDHEAAGFGWYLNTSDADFQPGGRLAELGARLGTDAVYRIDLLTTILHEMGHLLGHDHAAHGLMQPTLGPGVRRLPIAQADLLEDHALQPDRLDAYFAMLD